MKKHLLKGDHSPTFIGFIQAVSIFIYVSLVSLLMISAQDVFQNSALFLGPLFFLVLLVASVLICAVLAFGHPIVMFWEEKKTREAVKVVTATALWLTLFVVVVITGLSFV